MGETKTFPLRTILTSTTRRLLTEPKGPDDNGIGDLYALLSWMADDPASTHTLGRFADECNPWLFRWFPELAACGCGPALKGLDRWLGCDRTDTKEEGVRMWLAELKMTVPALKDEYDVPRIPAEDHERKDPYDELVATLGTDEGIVIVRATGVVEP